MEGGIHNMSEEGILAGESVTSSLMSSSWGML